MQPVSISKYELREVLDLAAVISFFELSQSWVASNSRGGYGGHLCHQKNVVFVLKTKKKVSCLDSDLNPGPMDYGQKALPPELLVQSY